MPDSLLRHITFDSTEITFDSCEITWDNCTKSKPEVIQQHLKISGGVALVVEHGDDNQLYSRIDVYHDISLAIKLTNPMFNEVGSHSIPFRIPASAHNLKVFGFPGRVERYTEFKNRQYPMYIYAEGLHLLTGNLVITSADPSTIECYFKSGNGDFWSAVRDTTLQDIDLGESPTFATPNDALAYMNSSTTSKYPDMPFAMFPLVNYGMSKDFIEDEIPNINSGAWRGVTMVNWWDPVNSTFEIQWCSSSPYMYLNYVIDKLFDTYGLTSVENFIAANPELRTLVLYNNVSKFWQNNPSFTFPYPGTRPSRFTFRDYVQKYGIADFILNLEKLFCATLFVNDRVKEVKFTLFKDMIQSQDVVKIKRVVSDINMIHGQPFDSAVFTFENDTEAYHENDIKDFEQLYKIPEVAVFPLPTATSNLMNAICLVRAKDIYYMVEYSNDNPPVLQWKRYSKNIKKDYGEKGNVTLDVSSEIFTLPMYYGKDIFDGMMPLIGWSTPSPYLKVSWPKAHQRNLFDFKNEDDDVTIEFTPRLLFYRGLQPDLTNAITPFDGQYYPLGTFDVYKTAKMYAHYSNFAAHMKIPDANLALQWDGPHGLIENFYKEYLQWKMAGPDKLEFNAWFDVTELAAIDFSKKYAINNNHMFLDSVEFALTHTGVTVSKVTAYKI
jgi:hypothetical protein